MFRDNYYKHIEADNGVFIHVSAGEIEGAEKPWDEACLLQVGTEMGGCTCAYLDDATVWQLIESLQKYLQCEIRTEPHDPTVKIVNRSPRVKKHSS